MTTVTGEVQAALVIQQEDLTQFRLSGKTSPKK